MTMGLDASAAGSGRWDMRERGECHALGSEASEKDRRESARGSATNFSFSTSEVEGGGCRALGGGWRDVSECLSRGERRSLLVHALADARRQVV
jgi:hypothetical protein